MKDSILVGHSVSAMIAMLACLKKPGMFSKLVMIGPSPCYINDPGYTGGFTSEDIDELLASIEDNYLGWSAVITPQIMGNPDSPELAEELKNSFCRMNPKIALHFARVTFLSDNRGDLKNLQTPTLILQCSEDIIVPLSVGQYLEENIARNEMRVLAATGHCPHLSAPEETSRNIRSYLLN